MDWFSYQHKRAYFSHKIELSFWVIKQYAIVLFIAFLSHTKKKGKKENLRPTVKIKNRNRKITEVSESHAVFNGNNRSSLKGYITDTDHRLFHHVIISTCWISEKIKQFNMSLVENCIITLPNAESKEKRKRKDAFLWLQFILVINSIKPLSVNPTKWSNTLKQFIDKLSTNCLSVFGHFVKLALKGLNSTYITAACSTTFFRKLISVNINMKNIKYKCNIQS